MKRSSITSLVALALPLVSATVALAAPAGDDHAAPTLLNAPNTGMVTAITTLIVFILLLAILSKFAWGPITKGLAEREQKIRDEIQNAEKARLAAEARLREYDAKLATADAQVRELLNKATADAERAATTIRMQAQQESEEAKERAIRDIEAARKDALRDVYEQTAMLATTVAEKILRRNLNADDQRDLVNASLEQLQGAAARN
ncbi:MAG TPA: F0F1 ATP synthase subunit B [Tepidisphaeraceae bacterium]|nr:F0F1 ATP synthase subunit B [Tepidisphaeraceae bacterium]